MGRYLYQNHNATYSTFYFITCHDLDHCEAMNGVNEPTMLLLNQVAVWIEWIFYCAHPFLFEQVSTQLIDGIP